MLSIGWWLPVFDVILYTMMMMFSNIKRKSKSKRNEILRGDVVYTHAGDVILVAVFKFSLENLDYNTTIPTRLARP